MDRSSARGAVGLVIALTTALFTPACHCTHPVREGSEPRTTVAAAEPTEPENDAERALAVPESARGMWVWGTKRRLDAPDGASSLLDTIRLAELTEVYVSLSQDVLDDPRLPPLLDAIAARGVRIEALTGEATWSRRDKLPAVLAVVDAVAAYNAGHTTRFAGLHFDIEPHQLPENRNNHAFVPALAATLRAARERAAKVGLTVSADLPRFALEEHGPLFAEAVQRPFVMLYELRDRSPEALARQSRRVLDNTYRGVSPTLRGRLVVGVRMEDYPSNVDEVVHALDSAHIGDVRYGGSAVHDEAKYRAASTDR
ncbi:MAG: hypothetical protein KF894_22025 [Labilithrix sp.]|nr:hypothetical protein [Labilithrix sp.]